MKTLYLDCSMGAAGDMLTAALFDLLPEKDKESFLTKLSSLGIPGVTYEAEKAVKCGITGTHMTVRIEGQEEDEHMHDHHDHDHEHEHHHEHGHDHHDHSGEHDHHEHVHAHDHHHDHDHEHDHHHDDCGCHSHHHNHSSMHDIEHIVRDHLHLPTLVALDVMSVYQEIAEAESHVHGVPVDQIHFHEVGTMDAVADIVAVCLLMNQLKPGEVIASPVHVGSGQVKCAHGVLPVPAPATAYILQGIPTYGGEIRGELCTPTGAALLKHFVTKFGPQPMMRISSIGYGMGKKDFPRANCVRAMIGETVEFPSEEKNAEHENTCCNNNIIELSCNVDDMTGEAIGFAMERLFEAGANEVYTVPCGMKKSRPGILLSVLCKQEDREKMVSLLFTHTTTIGIRELQYQRYTLDRTIETFETSYGPVRKKISSGYGVKRVKYEHDDLARIAKEQGISLSEAMLKVHLEEK